MKSTLATLLRVCCVSDTVSDFHGLNHKLLLTVRSIIMLYATKKENNATNYMMTCHWLYNTL